MQLELEIHLANYDEDAIEQNVTNWDDIDKIGAKVATSVRRWLRSVPLRKQGARSSIQLNARWVEREPRAAAAPKGKRRKKAEASSES
jgi:hypothetical protein